MFSPSSLSVALTSFFHLATSGHIVNRQVLGTTYGPLTPVSNSIGVYWEYGGPTTVAGCLIADGSIILTSNISKDCPLFTAKLSADNTASNIFSPLGYPCTFSAANQFYCNANLKTQKANTYSNFTEYPTDYISPMALTSNAPTTYNTVFYVTETFTTAQAWNSSAAAVTTDGDQGLEPTVFMIWGAAAPSS